MINSHNKKFDYVNTLPNCSGSFHCQNSLWTYRVIKIILTIYCVFRMVSLKALTDLTDFKQLPSSLCLDMNKDFKKLSIYNIEMIPSNKLSTPKIAPSHPKRTLNFEILSPATSMSLAILI